MFVAACATGPSDDGAGDGSSGQPGMQVIKPDTQDVSPPLTELAEMSGPGADGLPHEAEPVRPIPHMQVQSAGPVVDPVVQSVVGSAAIPAPTANFEGMGAGLSGFTVQSAPPDTDGDIGPNHYVQIVNTSVTIFNRSGGIVMGPVPTKTFWNGFNGACATTNDGDGVVRYDRYADRWVISQFSVNGGKGPFFQCVAVSTTANPTGTYTRYQFSFSSLNDYPKLALWPDGYYFTYNLFSPTTGAFQGARVCAADRAKMIAGQAATQICASTSIGGLLATDLDGPTLPPAGTPENVLALNTTGLDLWKLHVDFATPSNSTFSQTPTLISVSSYTPLCNGGTCVPQQGTTNRLDSLADRLMNRAVYREFSDHNAVVVTHAVAGTGGSIRWYELRNMRSATPTRFQQSSYAPDSSGFRWMSSAAFDGAGNIGLGFSISSSQTSPGIHYTGRLAADILNKMTQGEGTIVDGTGSQTGNLTRWGRYSSMNIDPTDDCTFWYTSEYLGASGTFNWHTRIASFKLPNCGNDFSISVSPASQTVNAGTSVSYTVTTAVTKGSAQTVNLSVSGLPSGVTASFNPASVTAGGSSTLTLTAASTAPSSTATFTVTGTGTSATHTASASLTVAASNDFSISVSPASQTVNAGASVSYTVTTAVTKGSAQTINLSVSGLASGVTASFSPTSVTAGNRSTLTLTAAASAPSSTATFTVTGTGTSTTHTASASLTVVAANNGCLNAMFPSTDVKKSIPDNTTTGVTSTLAVTGSGNVGSLVLSLSITHSFVGDLVVTLIAPDNTQFVVWNQQGASGANLVINQAISAFGGHVAAGTWKLKVQDLAQLDIGTINSWSLTIAGTCSSVVTWSGSATPNMSTADNGTVCTSLTVPTTTASGTDSVLAKLNISGTHSFCASLSGTLQHNGTTVTAFPTETFPAGPCTFSLTSSSVPGLSGDARGTWMLCITDNDLFGDTGKLNSWSVHN